MDCSVFCKAKILDFVEKNSIAEQNKFLLTRKIERKYIFLHKL